MSVDAPPTMSAETTAVPAHLPERIGPYRLKERLGRGGMGEVYRAYHETLEREVAIKAIHQDAIADEHRERFRQEARLAAGLNHPAIVQIYDLLQHEGNDFIVMELVEGSPLRLLQRHKSFTVPEMVDVGHQIAEALGVAHGQGIMHRDLKSENVMLTEKGRVKLLDFGLAKRFKLPDGESVVEEENSKGRVLGTLRAMSPEQARGQKLDGRSDLFALGVLLYELAAGRSPFRAKGVAETLQKICSHQPTPVHRLRPDLPMEFSRVLDHLMEKDPALRPQHADEICRELRRLKRLFADEDSGAHAPLQTANYDSETGVVSGDLQDLTLREDGSAEVPLPGRAQELDLLRAAWTRALEGNRQMIFLSGEAGIGKSTLVAHFSQELRARERQATPSGPAIAEGRCLEMHGSSEAYMPLLEALGRLCRGVHGRSAKRVLLQWAPSWLLQMPWAVDEEERDEVARRALGAGPARRLLELLEALDAFCRRRPLVLVLEDLHWSDVPTLELLSALARRIEPARLLVIGTIRTSEMHSAPETLKRMTQDLVLRDLAREIPLRLLESHEVTQLLDAEHPGRRVTPEIAKAVHRFAGGNPLFSKHLADAILREGQSREWQGSLAELEDEVSEDSDDSSGILSQDLLRILESLLQRASDEEQRLLEIAGIAGERFLLPVVAAAAERPEGDCERLLDGLARRRAFLRRLPSVKLDDGRPAKRYTFLHNIYRRVLRRRISFEVASRCHRVVAAELEKRGGTRSAGELAMHYELGGLPKKAVAQYDRAALVAIARGAYGAAVEHVRRAEELLLPLPENDPELLGTRVGLYQSLGLALFATRGYSVSESGDAFRRAEAVCRQTRDPRLFFIQCGRWVYHWMRAEIPVSLEIAERAKAGVEQSDQAGPYAKLLGRVLLGASHMRRGDFARALEHFESGLELGDRVDLREVFQSFPLVEGRVFGRVFGGLTQWYLGRPETARRWALEGCRLANELGHAFSRLNASSVAATLFLLCGDVARARELHLRAESLSEEHGYAISLTPQLRSVLFEPNPAAAASLLDVLERKMRAAQERGDIELQNVDLLMLSHARRHAGRLELALESLKEGAEMARHTDDRWYEAELLRLQGDLTLEVEGNYPEIRARVDELFHRSLEVAEAQGANSWVLRTACSLARLHGDTTAAEASRERLAEAIGRFEEGHETADLRIAKALLASLS